MKTATEHFEDGEDFRFNNEFDNAINSYKKAIEINPLFVEAVNNLGLTQQLTGNDEEAIASFERCLEIDPKYRLALRNLAFTYQISDPKKAIDYFQKEMDFYPNSDGLDVILNSIGVTYLQLEDYESAEEYFIKSKNNNPLADHPYYNLGRVHLHQKNEVEASKKFLKAIEVNPNYKLAYFELGKLLVETSPEEAKKHFDKYAELHDPKINALNDVGNFYYENKLYPTAISYYEKCIELDKNFEYAYYNIGLCNEKENKKKAIQFYEEAEKINPKWYKPPHQIGTILYNQNKREEAITYFEKSLELEPTHSGSLYFLGLCYQYDDPKKTKFYYLKAITNDPTHFDAHIQLGRVALMEGNLEMSREYFNKSIEIKPNTKWGHYNLAFSYMKTDQTKAIEYFEKAIEIDEDFFDAYNNIYFSISALEDRKEPTEKFIDFVEQKNNANGYWALGNLYQYTFLDFPESLKYYERSKTISNNHDLALDLSNLFEMMNDHEKSIEVLDEALNEKDDFIYAMHNKAHFLFNMGRYGESRDIWKKVAIQYEDKLENDIIFNKNSNNFLYLGTIYREIFEDFEKAEETLRKGIKLDASNLSLLIAINQVYVDVQNKAVVPSIKNFWKRNANIQKAENLFKNSLKIEDDYFNMAELYFIEEKFDKASSILQEFLKKAKPSTRILALSGLVNLSREKFREAIQNFKDAQRLSGQNLSLMTNLANAYFKNKEYSKAERAYLKSLKIDPNNVDALIGLGEINLDRAEDSSSRDLLDVAEKYFIDALKKGKSDGGSIQLNIHELRTANSERKYKDLKLSDLYYSLGYIKTKQFEKDKISLDKSYLNDALRYFSRSFEANPDNFKAQSAKKQILNFSKTSKKDSTTERLGAGLISVMALLLFVLAQYFFFFRNNTSTEFSLGNENSTFLQSALPLDSLQGSKMANLAAVKFKNKTSLLNAINEIAGQKNIGELGMLSSLTFAQTTPEKDNNKLTPGFFALISFGSLIFLIAGLYLPKLLKLKVGVIEIEKNAPTEAKAVSFLSMQR